MCNFINNLNTNFIKTSLMKKFNLLIAAGLMGAVSVQAQTTIAKLGFEPGDEKFTTDMALTPGLGTFGDWVNVKDGDSWTEQNKDDVKSGEYALLADNGETAGQTWDRGFKIGNLPIKENTPYRISFWIKAEPSYIDESGEKNTALTAWLSQGIENYDKSFCSPSGANYGVQMTSGLTGEWQHISFVSYYTNADVLNNVIASQDWVGNAVFPEEFGGDGTQTYAQYYGGKLPEKYFVIVNMYSPTSYVLDDILVEEGVTFNEATFANDVIKLDFGYPTNIAALANAEGGSFSLPTSCVTVTANGTAVPVEFVEGKSDGYLYIFLNETYLKASDDVQVSFAPAADCSIVYHTDRRPSSNVEGDMAVLGFTNEKAYAVDDIDALPSSWSPAKMVSSVPENDSFEIDGATFNNISVTYDKEVSLDYASATLVRNGVETDLTDGMTLSEDQKTVNVAVSNLADGEYTLIISGVTNIQGVPCTTDQEITFAVGQDSDDSKSESVYSTNETFAVTANGTFPVGWVANDNGTIHQYGVTEAGDVWNYNWGGNIGGGGTRAMTGYSGDLNGAAIYWRSMDGANQLGTLTYGEQVKDYVLADGTIDSEMPEGIALHLDARKYQITIRMCAWKNLNGNTDAVNADNAPLYSFTLEDLAGNIYARFDDVPAMPNVNGAQDVAVNNVTRSQTDFTVDKAGYYMLKFTTTQPNGEYLLGGVDLITMPSKAAYYRQLLAEAVEKAEVALESAKSEEYDGETKTALTAAINNAKTGHFTSPSEINALIAELGVLGEKMAARVQNIDDFSIALIEASVAYEGLEGKYLNAEIAVSAKAIIDQYGNTNPSNLSDAELAEVTPKLVTASKQLANVQAVVDVLTWGAFKAASTATNLGVDGSAGYSAVTDDRNLVASINAASTVELYKKIAANEDLAPYKEKVYSNFNQNPDSEDGDPNYDDNGYPLIITGINFTGLIHNPKFYTYSTNSGANLADNTIVGWNCNQLEGGALHFSGEAPTEAMPVSNVMLNAYGGGCEYEFYQTIENAPVGVYDVYFQTRTAANTYTNADGESIYEPYNAQNDETGIWDKYIFAQAGDEDPIMVPFAAGGSFGVTLSTVIPNVTVKEGQTLTIGIVEHYTSGKATKNGEPLDFWDTNTFANDARLFFVAPLEGYDYAKAAADLETGIESVGSDNAETAKVAGIYNVNGAKVNVLQKGLNIVKYSNGVVRKVLVK